VATGIEDLQVQDLKGVEDPNGSEAVGPEARWAVCEYRARADAFTQRLWSLALHAPPHHLRGRRCVARERAPIGWLAVCSIGRS
jgi:hypothetical protein